MIYIKKKMLFLMMTALLVVGQVGAGSAIPARTCHELDQDALVDFRSAEDFAGAQVDGFPGEAPPMGLSYSGRGSALKDHESHDLMMTVVNLMPPDPLQVQRLLASNKSIEEIRDEINAMQEKAIYRGFIKLEEMVYPLVNINSSPSGGNSISWYADVVEPAFDLTVSDETSIAGIAEVTVTPREGGLVGNGELIMNRGPYNGSYKVTLDVQPIEPR